MKLSNRQKGMICIILSAFFFACMNVCVKMSGDLPSFEKAFFRNFIATFVAAVTIIKSGSNFHFKKSTLPYYFLRAAFGTLGLLCNFYAVDHLLLADASTIQKLVPFITIIACFVILKEKVTKKQLLFVLLAFLSSLLVIKPTFSNTNLFPSLVALLGSFGAGMAYCFVRILTTKGEDKPKIIFFFSIFSCIAVIPYIAFNFVMPTFTQFIILIMAGIFASGGQFAVTYAYGYAPANQISIMDYSQIIFAALLGFFFFAQVPDIYSFIGYALIILVALLNYYTNQKAA